jgi:hypothetical protein
LVAICLQTNYRDSANVPDDAQDALMREAQKQLAPYANVTEFMRMFTSEAAAKVPNASLDYVYVGKRTAQPWVALGKQAMKESGHVFARGSWVC